MKDLKNNLDIATSLAPDTRNASASGSAVDLQGFDGAMVVFVVGTITDGTHTPKVQESDDNSTYTDVAAADLEGTLSNLASNTNQRVGYKGRKRYIKAAVTVSGATSGGKYAAFVVREPFYKPAA